MRVELMRRVAGSALIIASAGSCSLVLEELSVSCRSKNDCRALNEAHGLDPEPGGSCSFYQCREDESGCELRARDEDRDGVLDAKTCGSSLQEARDCDDGLTEVAPGAAELCDGIDNDCDSWIDEGELRTEASSSAILGPPEYVSYSGTAGQAAVTFTSADANSAATHYRAFAAPPASELCSCQREDGCDYVVEMATDADDQLLLALALDLPGCIDGRLQVGARRVGANAALTMLAEVQGPAELTAGLPSGDRSCPNSEEPRGARSPSLALRPAAWGGPTAALALFRADSHAKPDKPAGLAAIGVHVSSDDSVQLTNGGVSELINEPSVRGQDAASVVAWGGATAGYFVGYDSERGVELAFVSESESSGPILGGTKGALLVAESGVRQVVVAIDPVRDRNQAVPRGFAAAWRSSRAGQSGIRLARVSFSPQSATGFALDGDVLSLPTSGQVVQGPAIAYARAGFSTREDAAGGWFVTWVERQGALERLRGTRVAEVSSEWSETPYLLGERMTITHPFAGTQSSAGSGDQLSYAFFSGPAPEQLNIGSLACGTGR